ncbi:MAG: hypothetical protein MUO26_15990 [Methanotrichaceae archaeon]|nr:hypothetical protein [Methanotrichaceae archaeon]
MDEEFDSGVNIKFPADNALYHTIKGLIFLRGDCANRVSFIFRDENNRNFEIKNPLRLKNRLFRQIMNKYNARIDNPKYGLLFPKLSDIRINDVEVLKLKLVENSDDDDYSGRFEIYPKTFVCSVCGDFLNIKGHWGSFDPRKCRNSGCNGNYEQVSIVMFCEICGKIKPLEYYCNIHSNNQLRLWRRVKDLLATWRVGCYACIEKGEKKPIDIFIFHCDHMENREKISEKEDTKFKPLTIKEGGVYSPVVITTIDIPKTESIGIVDLEYVLLAIHLGKFDQIPDVSIESIEDIYGAYNSPHLKKMGLLDPKIEKYINLIESEKFNLKNTYKETDLEIINDYYSIKAVLSKTYSDFIEENSLDGNQKSTLNNNFMELKNRYGIREITYIPEINLVSSCIGIINGINKFYDKDFVPHFNPIWETQREKNKIHVYAYPFRTEGLLIDLDKIRVCEWLYRNDLIKEKPRSENEAKQILMDIKLNMDSYIALSTLLHTLSHLLIRRSSLYTGLDSDSCSELIFANSASILIYSTSSINIGGLQFVFEHSLSDWFKEIEFDTDECTLDPACIFEKGACFSCMYLQEYICTGFNQLLDRDVFLGKKRFKSGFWRN